jgi:hypothetical protein
VRHAARGTRNMDGTDEQIVHLREISKLRLKGRGIVAQSIVGAALITTILMLL